ncbi:uncharacterized protein [Diadema setosum]|uniref:uncharacterized protein n=1 Tax=Diadema setosum TaxID=31175 RepID=UPI003B3AE43F
MLSELDTVSPSEVETQVHSEATLALLSEMSTPGTFSEPEGGILSLPEVLSDTDPNSDVFKSLGSPDSVSELDHDENTLSSLRTGDPLFLPEVDALLIKKSLSGKDSPDFSSSSSSLSSEDYEKRGRSETEIKVENPMAEVLRIASELASPGTDDGFTMSSFDTRSLNSFSHAQSENVTNGLGSTIDYKAGENLHSDYKAFRQERQLFFESSENLGESLGEANANLQSLEENLDKTSHTLTELEQSLAKTRQSLQAIEDDGFTETSSGTDPDDEVKGVISKGLAGIDVDKDSLLFHKGNAATAAASALSDRPSGLESLRGVGETASPTPLSLKIDYLRDYDELFPRDVSLVDDESGNSTAPLQSPPHHYVSPGIIPESSLPKLPELSREMVAQLDAQTHATPGRRLLSDETEGGGDDILGDLPNIGFQGPGVSWQRQVSQSMYVSKLRVQIPRPGELVIPPGSVGSATKSSSPGSDDSLRRQFGTLRNSDDLVSCSELSFGNLENESMRVHCEDAAYLPLPRADGGESLSENESDSEIGSEAGTSTSSNDSCVYQYKVSEARYTKTHSKSSLGESGSSSSDGDDVLAPDTNGIAARFHPFGGSDGIMTGNGHDLFADLEGNDFSLAASTYNSDDFD